MKKAADLSWLLSRDITWLAWWQEIILNWVSSWSNVGTIVVTRPDSDDCAEWDLADDLEFARLQLEEALDLTVQE